jgi:hypothetical protein
MQRAHLGCEAGDAVVEGVGAGVGVGVEVYPQLVIGLTLVTSIGKDFSCFCYFYHNLKLLKEVIFLDYIHVFSW